MADMGGINAVGDQAGDSAIIQIAQLKERCLALAADDCSAEHNGASRYQPDGR